METNNQIDKNILEKVTNFQKEKTKEQTAKYSFKTINGKTITITPIKTAKMEILIIDKKQQNTKTLFFKSLDRGSKLKELLKILEIETKY